MTILLRELTAKLTCVFLMCMEEISIVFWYLLLILPKQECIVWKINKWNTLTICKLAKNVHNDQYCYPASSTANLCRIRKQKEGIGQVRTSSNGKGILCNQDMAWIFFKTSPTIHRCTRISISRLISPLRIVSSFSLLCFSLTLTLTLTLFTKIHTHKTTFSH